MSFWRVVLSFWRFSYQEGRVVLSLEIQLSRKEGCFVFGDSVIKRGGVVLSLEIQLSRGGGCFVFGDSVIKRGRFKIQLSRGEGLRCSYQEGRV